MNMNLSVENKTKDQVINIALDTIEKNKQAIVFCSSKRAAEKQAEDIAKKSTLRSEELKKISEQFLKALSNPTKQCERNAKCIKKGIAFHHAGLVTKQRNLIEDNFRKGIIKIICSTPTLCLAEGTQVWSDSRNISIESYKRNNVFALKNSNLIKINPLRVLHKGKTSELMKINTVSGHEIISTHTHRFLVKRNMKKKLVPAFKILKNDLIATIGKLTLISKNKKISYFVKDNSLPIKDQFIDETLAYLIGAMLGDGYSGAEFVDNIIKYKGSPSIVGNDAEVFDNIKKACRKLKISYRKTINSGGTSQLILGKNKWFREFLVRTGVDIGYKKQIDESLISLPECILSNLLMGLFDTDGHVEKRGNIGYSSISLNLIKSIQKSLYRYHIVSRIRKKPVGSLKIHGKEHMTKEQFELIISENTSILNFNEKIGFKIKRKQEFLHKIVDKITSNILYTSCQKCNYKIYSNLFSGKSKFHKTWGETKKRILLTLFEKGKLSSNELKILIGTDIRKKDLRLNHHYELIQKTKCGNRGWYWELNEIGKYIAKNIQQNTFNKIFHIDSCPICNNTLSTTLKKGWKSHNKEGDIYWDQIRSIKKITEEKEVFDVVLPSDGSNDHLFVAEGFITHNSAGLDMPAFRTILRDLKRYAGKWGMQYIPVLEYEQMAGRAGRPGKETSGEAIAIASTEKEKEIIKDSYIFGIIENIQSKLAVEPVLRTYVLSLIAVEFITTEKELIDFFSKTFYAHQFGDMNRLSQIIDKVVHQLKDYGFLAFQEPDDFQSANEIASKKITATPLGTRVSELYLDPYTAHNLIEALRNAINHTDKDLTIGLLHAVIDTLEMEPLLPVRSADIDSLHIVLAEWEEQLLKEVPSEMDYEFDDFLRSIKTTLFFKAWIEERDEEELLERFQVRPGETRAKLERLDWLLRCCIEIMRFEHKKELIGQLVNLQTRLKYGINKELLPLIRIKGVGRIRARKLYEQDFKTLGDFKPEKYQTVVQLVGTALADSIYEQLGKEVKKNDLTDFL